MSRFWLMIIGLLGTTAAAGNTTAWQDVAQVTPTTVAGAQARGVALATSPLQEYRLLGLDEASLKGQLATAATPLPAAQARAVAQTISLPLPSGGFTEVVASPNEVLAPDIAAQHPEIQTWKVTGTDGKVLDGVIDITPLGFHAMLTMPNGDTVFIDPQGTTAARQYASFSKRANALAFSKDWTCGTQGGTNFRPDLTAATAGIAARAAAKAGETLRTYRIAVAATGEYTAANGGTAALGFAAISTIINRVSQTYQHDLSIQLQLVSGTNIVYTNPATDPYTNSSPYLMMGENQTNLDNTIGSAAYDVGHVFGTAGGGYASVGAACSPSTKGSGATGVAPAAAGTTLNPNALYIGYVAHELGHQFGATHTFNSTQANCGGGNREPLTAYEPGSGSSIMSYSGICGSDDLQTTNDDMFHAASISQVEAYAHTNGSVGMACGTAGATNVNPVVNAGSNYTIPARTPFILTGSATDASGQPLTYSWEQMDAGVASNVAVDTGNNAIIPRLPAHPITDPHRSGHGRPDRRHASGRGIAPLHQPYP